MDINQKITEELGVAKWQVDAAVSLIDDGNTIPFISRYRKEATGTTERRTAAQAVRKADVSAQSGRQKSAGAEKH